MEKQPETQPDSLTTVTVKEYPPSEVYGTEPPPAYQKPRSTAVQIARIAAVTVVLVSFVLGSFILAAAWVQARASCEQFQQLQALAVQEELAAAAAGDQPSFQHLVAPAPDNKLESDNKLDSGEQELDKKEEPEGEVEEQEEEDDEEADSDEEQEEGTKDKPSHRQPIQIHLPLQLDFDEIAGALVEKNQRSRMNCVVEKRRAEEIVDHQARTVRLPFGVNLTTDPRYEHVSGEKMVIFCESGKDQRHVPMEMMPTPVVVPLPGPVHLPLQFHGPMQQPARHPQMPVNRQPAVGLVPPPPSHEVPVQMKSPSQREGRILQHMPEPEHVQQARPMVHLQAPPQREARTFHQMPIPVGREPRNFQQMPIPIGREPRNFQQMPIPVGREPRNFQHIPLQFEPVGRPLVTVQHQSIPIQVAEGRGFNPEAAAAAVAVMHAAEVQRLPIHVPVPMMQHIQVEDEEPPQAQESQPRPHYVQPRSVRSVDEVLHRRDKRVKRCACNCAC